ncbi:hypothetical protein [Burkholderia thailandensis]|uniref:Lipoprotein n=2 Tax=Burkholderia thailandensis TaxID=57975 RepID=A0AAW9D334_BURTH|nr:hypothetical protein [Burkholderia thailandensis]ABC39301.1 lipoprotein, putative [Burkholderia thailandensis E264]AHI64429.1 putative lipoprotein [Burkholderia thailandensis H0587]AHI73248.1 putative membrane protein [Burkholderia thailandensis 2002721723]AHI80481.1 putative membrane protein [Burkholderia thailandensis E444]AIC88367.1 putative membrane protein [Burkholderia thailandensis USAMRU Malaysia \
MRWQYPVAAALAIAALVWACARIVSTDAAPAAAPAEQTESTSSTALASAFAIASSATPRSAPPPLPPRVAEYIAHEYANSAVTREALTQIAYGWSQAVNDVHDPGDAKTAGDAIAKGIACALSARVLVKAGVDQQTMLDRIKSTRAIMLDTEADTLAYIRFQSLAGGQFFDDPGPASCGFNPTSMPN